MGNFLFGFTLYHIHYIFIRVMNDLVYYHPWKWSQPITDQLLSWFFTKSRQCHDFRRNHRQFGFSLESQLQKYNWITVLLHRKLKGEKTKRLKHYLQNSRQNLSFEGVRSPKRGKLVCARVHYLPRPTVSPKYKPWLDQTRPDIFPNRAKTCTITYDYREGGRQCCLRSLSALSFDRLWFLSLLSLDCRKRGPYLGIWWQNEFRLFARTLSISNLPFAVRWIAESSKALGLPTSQTRIYAGQK